MNSPAWLQIVLGLISLLGVFVTAFFAYRASKYSKPVGNGFAEKVLTHLGEIQSEIGDLKGQIGYVRGRIDQPRFPAAREARSWAETPPSY